MEISDFIKGVQEYKEEFWLDNQGKLCFRQLCFGNIKHDARYENMVIQAKLLRDKPLKKNNG